MAAMGEQGEAPAQRPFAGLGNIGRHGLGESSSPPSNTEQVFDYPGSAKRIRTRMSRIKLGRAGICFPSPTRHLGDAFRPRHGGLIGARSRVRFDFRRAFRCAGLQGRIPTWEPVDPRRDCPEMRRRQVVARGGVGGSVVGRSAATVALDGSARRRRIGCGVDDLDVRAY